MDRSFANQLDVPDDHAAIREGVRAVVSRFDDEYWLARDEDGEFPRAFHDAPVGKSCTCALHAAPRPGHGHVCHSMIISGSPNSTG